MPLNANNVNYQVNLPSIGNTQTAYVLTLYTGMARDEERSVLTDHLVAY